MKEVLFTIGGAVLGIGGALAVGWYLLARDMEKWW